MWDCGTGGHMGGWGWITLVLVWTLIVLGVAYLWRTLNGGAFVGRLMSTDRGQGDRALAILRERYARGEISSEEFERMERDLS
jgi:putative membrane protein